MWARGSKKRPVCNPIGYLENTIELISREYYRIVLYDTIGFVLYDTFGYSPQMDILKGYLGDGARRLLGTAPPCVIQ